MCRVATQCFSLITQDKWKSSDHSMMFFPNGKGNTSCNHLMFFLDCLGEKEIFFFKTSNGHLLIFFLDMGWNALGSNLIVLLNCPRKTKKKNFKHYVATQWPLNALLLKCERKALLTTINVLLSRCLNLFNLSF